MSKKKKIILTVITIIIIIIISFIFPVETEIDYKYSNGNFDINDINNHMSGDCTIYTYKNIYGITIKTSYELGHKYY